MLGLAVDGATDETTVELNALKRMDVLRPHQLRHPDLVTEGMNRLAQAMIALTSNVPLAKADSFPKKPKKSIRERTPVEIRKPKSEVKLDFEGQATGIVPLQTPAILDAEIVGVASSPAAEIIPESFAVQADEPTGPPLDEPITIPEPPLGTVLAPSPRRSGYRELVRLRRYRDAWGQFRSILGDPSEMLVTPVKVMSYLDAIAALRSAMRLSPDPANPFPDLAGQMVVSVTSHPVPLSLLRDLVPSQRRILARDWAVANAELDVKAKRLRRLMRNSRRKGIVRRLLRQIRRFFENNPEWIILVILVGALLVGFGRS